MQGHRARRVVAQVAGGAVRSSDRYVEARPHPALKELIGRLDFLVRFSFLALLTFEAEGFFVVGTVLHICPSQIPICGWPSWPRGVITRPVSRHGQVAKHSWRC